MINQKIRRYWDRLMAPVGRMVARSHVNPNVITIFGVIIQAVGAVEILNGRLVLAAIATSVAGAADVLDGAVAKARGVTSRFGALLDSTTDRLSDALFFVPVAWLYGVGPDKPGREMHWVAALALGALVAAFLVSYIKARSEALGYECNVGIAERAERWILMVVGLLFDVLPWVTAVLAAVSLVTVVQRLLYVRRQAIDD
ncbi:MAG: CDP-alcohol phosphatidyltransferase family protein [Actinomycetota bacterium]|nr:CDP-alcohol phosphatidyltransferase family protein [Actinomycetota bacterium]